MKQEQSFLKQHGSRRNFLTGWIQRLSVGSKFTIIIVLIIFVLLAELGNFYFAMKTMSGLRSLIAGQDFWSKAQKDIHRYLVAYSVSHDEADYRKILDSETIYQGDHQARLEILKKNMNYQVAKEGFIMGEVHADDVDDTIFVLRTFRPVSYVDKALSLWAQGDVWVQQFIDVSEKVHEIIVASGADKGAILTPQQEAQVAELMAQADGLDNQLTVAEKEFTTLLGETSRAVKNILLLVTVVLTVLLGAFVILITRLIQTITVQMDNAKNEFVYLASHQLRTPVSAIKWYSEMLADQKTGPLNEKQQKYLGQIHHGNDRMVRLVNNLLNIARIEMGRLKLDTKLVDPKALVEDVVHEHQFEISQRGTKVTVTTIGTLPEFFTDPFLLRVVLQNLVSNAIKYSPEQGTVACTLQMANGKMLFKVADNGIGIPEEDQKRIFEKLFRASNSMNQDIEGNGLGLYIIKGAVQILGGSIWFTSELGKGTTFYVELPLGTMPPVSRPVA